MSFLSRNRRRLTCLAAAACAAIAACFTSAAPALALGTWSSPVLVYSPTTVQTTAYSYAPAEIPGTTTRLWTCHSPSSGVIRDNVFETTISGSTVTSSTSVLSGTGSGWDSYHNCDPTVVQVDVTYGGTPYSYAMFYTGNDMNCSCHNQIGVAFATSLDGPWVKYPNPIVAFDSGQPTSEWGVGQPSATTINPSAGTVVLTWTSGYTSNPADSLGNFAEVDFSSSVPVLSNEHQIQVTGLTDLNGAPDYLNNFDIVYSPSRDVFYMIREAHPYPTSSPDYISTAVQLDSIPGSAMWSGSGSWTVLSNIGESLTGYPRTHNPGFSRTIYGTLPDESSVTVLYTTSTLDPNSLWSYEVWATSAAL